MISTDVTIIVFYGPKIVTLSPNTTKHIVNEGKHVPNINCSAECKPECILNWIGPKEHILPSNELSLQNINRSQAGTYKCNVTNKVSSMLSTDIHVIVNYGPSHVVLSPNTTKYPVKENESLQPSISCTATCLPPCVGTWTIHTGEFVSYDNLSFPAIKRNQTGSYRCNASNSVSSMISSDVSVIVTYGAEIKDIFIDGGNFTIPENVEKRLTCELDGVPKPKGRLFYNDEEKQIFDNPIVYVMVPLCNDTGNYTCAAENSEGKANQTKELFVLCSPRPVVDLQSEITVGNDSILEINVIFFSYPQPKISWTFSKNGFNEIVRSNDTIGIYQHISSIYITDMKTSQYGSYVLQVTNGIPNDLKHTFEVLPQPLEEESNIGLYIGASIGTFAAVFSIGLSVVVLFLRRKKYQGKRSERNKRMALADEPEYADEGLKDNILYETAGSDFGEGTTKVGYEVNNKKRHNKHGTDNSAFQETALYSVVQKKTGQDGVRFKENKAKKNNDKGKTNNTKNNKNEDVQEPSGKESSKQNLNKDGLQYADLVFSKSKTGPKFVIRGLENRTIYAVVDTTQKIDPLPESDDEEPSDKNTNNEESGI